MESHLDDRGKYFTPRINKESVFSVIRTSEHLIVGHIYVRPEHRLKDEINNDRDRFLAITDASVYNSAGTQLLFTSSFLLLAYNHVVLISPVEAVSDMTEAIWFQNIPEEAE
ncbi:MAG: hypothetical protein MI924_05775 [Chloroflexales bacterium]|nr:hypothetical protein [Chloroflexales bacterium]